MKEIIEKIEMTFEMDDEEEDELEVEEDEKVVCSGGILWSSSSLPFLSSSSWEEEFIKNTLIFVNFDKKVLNKINPITPPKLNVENIVIKGSYEQKK